jgi:3-methyladenine DNA glycosylase AlkC
MTETENAPLKDLLNGERVRAIGAAVAAVHPGFDAARYDSLALRDLDALSLTQRMRRVTEALRETLPADYRAALAVLRAAAPGIGRGFAALVPPDFIGLYGFGHVAESMEALRFHTPFGSSEFGVRPFLRAEPRRALAIMEDWAVDADEHVRRLASEGTRPRIPWSFRLEAIAADPDLAAPILERLRADPSLYVRKSVANHLNDVTKAHPQWVIDRLRGWPLDDSRTAWIAKRALRTLIKAGDARALGLIGAGEAARARIENFAVAPERVELGGRVALSFDLVSEGAGDQRLVVDYAIHYIKKAGGTSAKVFKLKELTLAPGARVSLGQSRRIQDFTTRTHHPGRHVVELTVNGAVMARGFFDLFR